MIDRSTFMFLSPKGMVPKKDHAQCAGCMMWTGPKHNTCTNISPKEGKVVGPGSCGGYGEGHPMPDHAGKEMGSWTKKEVGYVVRNVRCENCKWAVRVKKGFICSYFALLNHTLPDVHDLEEKIEPHDCCNAQEPNEKKQRARRRGQRQAAMRLRG